MPVALQATSYSPYLLSSVDNCDLELFYEILEARGHRLLPKGQWVQRFVESYRATVIYMQKK